MNLHDLLVEFAMKIRFELDQEIPVGTNILDEVELKTKMIFKYIDELEKKIQEVQHGK